MADHVGVERSVEAFQAYLIVFLQSLPDAGRDVFVERLNEEDGFMAAVLSTLHAVHDAMASCLCEEDGGDSSHASRLLESPDLFDSDLANVACFTLAKFSPAIVMDLDPAEVDAARTRLGELLASTRLRVAAIKLH